MTVAEAIKGLKELREWEGLPFCIEEPLGEAGVGVITEEALEMSIRSLEAWEKVKADIAETILYYKDWGQVELKAQYKEEALKEVLDCINRHLKGVT